MGHTQNADGSLVINPTPRTVEDMQAIADLAASRGAMPPGTRAQRLALTSAQVRPGWLFAETDTGLLFQWTGERWRLPSALLVGADKGETVCPAGSWRPLNTAAGSGVTAANDGFTFGTAAVTVPFANGLYEVSATITFPNAATGTTRGVRVRGADPFLIENLQRAAVAAGEFNMSVSGIVRVGPSFTIEAYHDSDASRTVRMKHVSARYVGPVG